MYPIPTPPMMNPPPPMSHTSDEDHDTSYEVETVLDEKREEGNKSFLVKSVGYPVPTWESEANLANALLVSDEAELVPKKEDWEREWENLNQNVNYLLFVKCFVLKN